MNYGRFFVLDKATSSLAQGIAVFNYKPLRAYEGDFNGETPCYPVYVQITSHAIMFNIHYYNSCSEPKHLSDTLFSLCLDDTAAGQNCLTTELKESYNTLFPNSDLSNDYILQLFSELKDSDEDDHFSALPVFGVNWPGDKSEGKQQVTFLRKLLLDFMFDLCHSSVFESSSYYNLMQSRLQQNFYFTALINKANFYYYKNTIEQAIAEGAPVQTLQFWASYLDRAEQNWLSSIRDSRSDEEFPVFPKWYEIQKTNEIGGYSWFELPEEEIRRVYYGESKQSINSIRLMSFIRKKSTSSGQEPSHSKRLKLNTELSSKWCLRRYDFTTLFTWKIKGKEYNWLFILLSLFFVSNIISIFGNGSPLYPICISAGILLLAVFSFMKDNIHSYLWGVHLVFPRLAAAIIAAWLTIALTEDLFKTFFDTHCSVWSCTLLSGVVLLFVYYEIDRIVPYLETIQKILRAFQLYLLSFLYAWVLGGISLIFSSDNFMERGDFLHDFYRNKIFITHSPYQLAETNTFFEENFYKDIVEKYANHPHEFVINSEKLVSRVAGATSTSPTEAYLAVTCRLIGLFNDSLPHTKEENDPVSILQNRMQRVEKSLIQDLTQHPDTLLYQSWIDSFLRPKQMDQLGRTFLRTADVNSIYRKALDHLYYEGKKAMTYSLFKHQILWNFLFQFSFFTLFIGIFIQLIFDERNITESI